MSGFIRVRAVDGPKHEFDAPVGEVTANPDLYEVLDEEVSATAREPKYTTDEITGTPLEKLTRADLDELARPLGIDPSTVKSKRELIDLINASPNVPTLPGDGSGGDAPTEPAGTANKEKN